MGNNHWQTVCQQAWGQLYPAYLVEEGSWRLLCVNEALRTELGRDPSGELCYRALMGWDHPCTFCPRDMEPGKRCLWEFFDKLKRRQLLICHLSLNAEGRHCRAGMIADMSEMMSLSAQLSGYLALMKQLNAVQAALINGLNDPIHLLLRFLLQRFGGVQASAYCRDRDGGTSSQILTDVDGVPEYCIDVCLPEAEPEEQVALDVLDKHYVFQLQCPGKPELWQEERDFVFGIIRPYLENTALREQLNYENSHDSLTRLGNRSMFARQSQDTFSTLPLVSVIYLDVDGLKHYNDTQGHDMGDRLLRKAARILRDLSSLNVYPYRMGGDEFLLVCPDYDEKAIEALRLRLQEKVEQSNWECPEPVVSFSVGCATGRAPIGLEALVTEADQRMYAQKRAKKNLL